MSERSISVASKLIFSFIVTLLVWICPASLQSQTTLYDQSFNVSGQGYGTPLATCSNCATYNSTNPAFPADNSWQIINLSGTGDITGNNFFNTSNTSGSLEYHDNDADFCFQTKFISNPGTDDFNVTIDLSESGTLGSGDQIDVEYDLQGDGSGFIRIPNQSGGGSHTYQDDFGSDQLSFCVNGTGITVRVCIEYEGDDDFARIERVLIETGGTTAQCTDCNSTATCGPCAIPEIDTNQDLAPCESLNIAFVIDESGSIQGNETDVANGVMGFLNGLACPNAKVAIIEFASEARYVVNTYSALDNTFITGMTNYFAGVATNTAPFQGQTYVANGATNWHHAMDLVDGLATTPDLVLFFTDGIPTAWETDGSGNSCGDGSTTQRPEIVNPMKIANKLKNEGAHMFMLGVGGVDTTNLQRLSGTTQHEAGTNSIGTADYALDDFSNLAACLAMFAGELCPLSTCSGIPACPGAANGSITIDIENTPGGSSYIWAYTEIVTNNMDNGTAPSEPFVIPNLAAGVYDVSVSVVVTAGCTRPAGGCVVQVTNLECVTLSPSPSNCTGSADGDFELGIKGGVPPYNYVISGGNISINGSYAEDDTMTISGLDPGVYDITVTDNGVSSCSSTCQVTIGDGMNGPDASCTGQNVSCFNGSDGEVSVTASSGSPGYSYLWNTSATSATVTGLAAGTYDVTVTDMNGCKEFCSHIIIEPSLLQVTCTSNLNNDRLNCNGDSNGSVSASASGGTMPYSYLWNTGGTTSSITGLGAGNFTVTVTDSKGCMSTCDKTITEPDPLQLICSTNLNNDLLDCNGDVNGSLNVTVSGGTAPYSYLWNNASTNSSISGLGAGIYEVTVTDAKGCVSSCTKTISEPPLLSCEIVGGQGTADASVTGGTVPYSYLWNTGATTQDLNGLQPGNYSLTVTDVNNCTTTCEVMIVGLTCSIAPTPCDTNNLKGASATVLGGTPPFTYLWSTGETTSSIEGLIPGTYTLLVLDDDDLESECEITIDRCFDCDESCETGFGLLVGSENCFDQYGFNRWGWTNGLLAQGTHVFDLYIGAVQCNINNGELVGEIIISYTGNQATVVYNMFDDFYMSLTNLYIGCEAIPLVNDVETVDPSQYPYQHSLSMAATDTFIVNVSMLPCEGIYVIAHAEVCEATAIECEITGTDVSCSGGNNGTASVALTGGLAPFSYEWNTGATTQSISSLTSGIYIVTVTDDNDCQGICEVLISYPSMSAPQLGPFCQNDAPYDLSQIFSGPSFAGSWIGLGVAGDIFYPSNVDVGNHKIYYVDDTNCSSATIEITVGEICCPLDYAEVNGRLLIGTQSVPVRYETDGILESVQKIEGNTVYDSQVSITLKEEFEVLLGTTFEAVIEGCGSND